MNGKKSKKKLSINTFNARSAWDVLRVVISENEWTEVHQSRQDATIQWFDASMESGLLDTIKILKTGQRVSKFPGMSEILGKLPFTDLLNRMNSLYAGQYSFFPRSWLIPQELEEFIHHLNSIQNKPVVKKKKKSKSMVSKEPSSSKSSIIEKDLKTYILKPNSGSGGDGIMLLRKVSDLPIMKVDGVVQSYVEKPLLLDGLKFDLRLYVLLTSVDPLRAYLANEGLARFCTQKYQKPTSSNLHKAYMHLTNYSLNKHSQDFEFKDNIEDQKDGSKQLLSAILPHLREAGCDVESLWIRIGDIVIKTLIAIQGSIAGWYEDALGVSDGVSETESECKAFQVLGFDILIDHAMRPHLLEVNSNPSLRIDYEKEVSPGVCENIPSPIDCHVKTLVLSDAMKIIQDLNSKSDVEAEDSEVSNVFEPLFISENDQRLQILNRSRKAVRKFAGVRNKSFLTGSQFCRLCRHVGLIGDVTCDVTQADCDIAFKRVTGADKRMGCVELLDGILCLIEKNRKSLHDYLDSLHLESDSDSGDENEELEEEETISDKLEAILEELLEDDD